MSWLVLSLVNRQVTVESSGLKVRGRLVAVSDSRGGRDHKPWVLVLQTPLRLCLVRDWAVISFDGRA
jgi:hypothetical protein